MELTPEQLIAQSKAMLEQTRVEGDKPFAGSSYDIKPTPIAPTPGIIKTDETKTGVSTSASITAKAQQDAADKMKTDFESNQELERLRIAKEKADLRAELGGEAKKPTTDSKTSVEQFKDLWKEQGMTEEKTQLTELKAQKAELFADFAKFRRKPLGETAGFAYGKISEEQQNVQDKIDFLTRQESSLVESLNNKSSYINTLMSLGQKDYERAIEEANKEFDKNYKIQTLYNTQATESQKNAQTFLTSVGNMIKEGNFQWNNVDDVMKANIYQQEIKAGWLPGTLETFSRSKPKASLMSTINGFDASGQGITTFVFSDENGMPGMSQTINNQTHREPKAGAEGLTPTQLFDRELKLAKDFEGYAKEARMAIRSITIVETGFNEAVKALKEGRGLNAQSQAVIIGFNKLLDPTSVVRESEYARTPEGQSLLQKLDGKILQIKQGGAGMTKQGLQDIRDVSVALLKGYQDQLQNYAIRTKNQADSIGADLSRVLTPDVIEFMNKELKGKTGAAEPTQADKDYVQQLIDSGFKITQ